MAQNPNLSNLDFQQAVVRCVDADNDALRIQMSDAVGMEIELSAADGDSINSYSASFTLNGPLNGSNTGTAQEVLGPTSAEGFSRVNLYVQSISDIASPPTLTVQVSPAASGNLWVSTSCTAAMSASSGTLVMASAPLNILAVRTRILISAALGASETGEAYILLGN